MHLALLIFLCLIALVDSFAASARYIWLEVMLPHSGSILLFSTGLVTPSSTTIHSVQHFLQGTGGRCYAFE
jgi:hypothetical protein